MLIAEGDSFFLQLLVELTRRTGNKNPSRHAPLAVLHTLHDAGRLAALVTVLALGCVHYLVTVGALCDFPHGSILKRAPPKGSQNCGSKREGSEGIAPDPQ